ncbi:MAG: hypothetical protein ABL897_14705 [Hyphomicrobium sp.]
MREHRFGARGQTETGEHVVDDTPRSLSFSRRETTTGRRRRLNSHLDPLPLTDEEVRLLPIAHRYSA